MKLDVLLFGEDAHLAMALHVVLSEQGYLVMHEPDATQVAARIHEFDPDMLITVATPSVIVHRRRSAEVFNVARPVDTREVLRLMADGERLTTPAPQPANR